MEKLKSETAIRCAKAAILLSSLKSFSSDAVTKNASQFQVDEKVEKLKMEKLKLRLKIRKLVKEKQALKLKIRIWEIVNFVCIVAFLYNTVNCV